MRATRSTMMEIKDACEILIVKPRAEIPSDQDANGEETLNGTII
jgi:hypothetical protein